MASGNSVKTQNIELFGIPCGNTVAVVGDPGTGKTTLLLNYLTNALIVHGKNEDYISDCLTLCCSDDERRDAFQTLNELFIPAGRLKQVTPDTDSVKTLRCFISLENNFTRVFKNHQSLITAWYNSNCHQCDQFVFIDATSFLSGRLEDKLRYPRLKGGNQNDRAGKHWKDQIFDFTLGGHHLNDDDHFGLYYQQDKGEPKRIEQLGANTRNNNPFNSKKHVRVFNIITRPIPDPFKRVRLLKDLLAKLFIRFPEYNKRILAIDSLSALMNPFEEDTAVDPTSSARRLHILNLVRWLEEYNVTTFMACEAEHDTVKTLGGQPLFLGKEERYLASGVIQLNYHAYPSGDIVRYLRIMKMRGAAHDMRPFAYGLGEEGIAWVEHLFGEAGNMR